MSKYVFYAFHLNQSTVICYVCICVCVLFRPDHEKYIAEKFGLGIATGSTFTLKEQVRDDIEKMCLPSLAQNEMNGIVTQVSHTLTHHVIFHRIHCNNRPKLKIQVENCSKFWFQPSELHATVVNYARQLNQCNQDLFVPCTDDDLPLNRTTIYVARDYSDNKFYRARLISYNFSSQMTFKGTVCFIDTGHTQKCELKDIYVFTKRGETLEVALMPPRCFPCRLAEIQPSTSNISGGYLWDRGGIDLFKQYTSRNEVKAEVKKSLL